MKGVLQQGQADGLCGLYSILNFLQTTEWQADSSVEGMRYLFDSSHELGWLNPNTLIDGFEDWQLNKIVNLQLERYFIDYKSYILSEVVKSVEVKSFVELSHRVASARGSIIAKVSRKAHWVLIEGGSGTPWIYDSAGSPGKPKKLEQNSRAYSLDWGVVILPEKRPKLVIEI